MEINIDKYTEETFRFVDFLQAVGVPTQTQEERSNTRAAFFSIIDTETVKNGITVLQYLQKVARFLSLIIP